MFLFIDTETNGVNPAVSRSVQIAWLLTDPVGHVKDEKVWVVRPDGFSISKDVAKVHGITDAYARKNGHPIREVLLKLKEKLDVADLIVGHNVSFDTAIIENDCRYAGLSLGLINFPRICTMRMSVKWCGIPKLNGRSGYKWPTLQELHRVCFGVGFEGAHNALYDVQATARCFFKLLSEGVIDVPLKNLSSDHGVYDSRVNTHSLHPKRQRDSKGPGCIDAPRSSVASGSPEVKKSTKESTSFAQPPALLQYKLFGREFLEKKLCISCDKCRARFSVFIKNREASLKCPHCQAPMLFRFV